jgi:hypothetical protein
VESVRAHDSLLDELTPVIFVATGGPRASRAKTEPAPTA